MLSAPTLRFTRLLALLLFIQYHACTGTVCDDCCQSASNCTAAYNGVAGKCCGTSGTSSYCCAASSGLQYCVAVGSAWTCSAVTPTAAPVDSQTTWSHYYIIVFTIGGLIACGLSLFAARRIRHCVHESEWYKARKAEREANRVHHADDPESESGSRRSEYRVNERPSSASSKHSKPAFNFTNAPFAEVEAMETSRQFEGKYQKQLDELVGLGFLDRSANLSALIQTKGDVNAAMNLVS